MFEPSANAWSTALVPASAAPAVIHLIQDIHAHAEAQRDIATTLERLRQENGGHLRVGIEGAAGAFHFEPYRAFPGDGLRRDVARELLDENKIAGPVFAGLTEKNFDLRGIETAPRYVANVDAYRRAAPLQKDAQARLDRSRRELTARKAALFPAPLANLDAAASAYRAGRSPLGDYLETLSSAAGDAGFAVETFLSAHRMEHSLDFARIEAEKRRFIEALVRAFNENEVGRIRDWILSASSEGLGAGRRFDYLLHAARAKGVDVGAFPALGDYVRYLHLADAVDADRLFAETNELERVAFAKLSEKTPGAADLIAADRRLFLTEKIVRFELTREEWTDYRDARRAGAAALSAGELAPFEDFYRVAEERDAELAANVRAAQVDAVVVGGFHTTGLIRALKAAGFSVDVVRPKISSAAPDQATAYLSGFAARKTPLERLFTRWKLFLALPAVIGVDHPLVPSVNDDAPWRFVQIFRRRAASQPALAPAVDDAARALLNAQGGDDFGAAFDDAMRRFSNARQRLGRRWLSETILYLAPLAIGVASGNHGLIAAGLFVKLFLLPAAHAAADKSDARARFSGRVGWSATFLAAYVGTIVALTAVGAPLPVSALLALAAPAIVHRANHRAVLGLPTRFEHVLFETLRLPRLAMSTDGTPGFSPEEIAVITRVSGETAAALAAWRARADRTQGSFTTDPVTELLERFHAEALASADPARMAAIAWGFSQAILQARLTAVEMQTRARRDETHCFMRGIGLEDMAQRLNNRLIPGIYQQIGMVYMAVGPELVTAIARGTEEAFTEAPRQLMSAAIADWRAQRAASVEAPDMRLRITWVYVRNLVTGMQASFQPLLVRGITAALNAAQFTPDEARERATVDIEDEFSTPSQMVAPIYRDVALELRNRRRGEQADAILAGLRVAIRLATRSTVAGALRTWMDSSPNFDQRNHDAITQVTVSSFANADPKSPDYPMLVEGFADAYVALSESSEDIANRVENDLILASAFWDQSNHADERLLRAALAVHRAVAARRGGDTAALIARGQDAGWFRVMRRAMTEGVRRTRSPSRGAALADMPGSFIRFARAQNFSMDRAVEAIRLGLMDADLTDGEAVAWIRANVAAALEGPLDPAGIERARLVRDVAHDLAARLTALGRPAAVEALIELTNVPRTLQRRLRVYGAAATDADDADITVGMLRVAAIDAISDVPGGTPDMIAETIHDANLSPAHLQVLITHQVDAATARFAGRAMLPEMEVWSSQMMDPDLRTLALVYLALSERYVREGDHERSHAVLSGLVEASVRGAMAEMDELHGRNLILYLNTLAYACLRDDAFELARTCDAAIIQLISPAPELPQVVGWVMDTLGEVNRQEGKPGHALRHGFEHTTLVTWRQVTEDFHRDAQAVKLMDRMYTTAKMLFQTGSHEAARVYLRKALDMLERRPKIRRMVNDALVDKMIGLEAASRLLLTRNAVELPGLMLTVQETIGNQMLEPNDDVEEAGFLLAVLYESNIEMCRTGDARYYERVITLGSTLYPADTYAQVRRINAAKALRYRAGAAPADRPAIEAALAGLYPTPSSPAAMSTQADVVDLAQYALARAALGHLDEGAALLRAEIARVSEGSFRALVNAEASDRLNGTLNTELAAVMTAANARPGEIVPHLVIGLTVEISDERTIFSMHRLLDPSFTNVDVLMAAIDLLEASSDKAVVSTTARVNAAILARTIAPALFPARLEAWKKTKSIKDIRERFELIDAIATTPWPGRQFALLRHAGELEFHERLYRESLAAFGTRKGLPVFEEWRDAWNNNQRELWLYAAQLARLGLVDESIAALRLARKWTADALKQFAPDKRLSGFAEDPGIMAIPFSVQADKVVVREGGTLLQGNEVGKMRSYAPMVAISAERLGDSSDWKSEKDFVGAMDQAARLIDRVSDPALRPLIDYVQSRLLRFTGRLVKARDMLRRAVANTSDDSDAVENRTRARVELSKYAMWDSTVMLGQRLTDSERMIVEAKPMPGYDGIHGGYQELVLAMFQFDPADPAACLAVVDRALALLAAALKGNEIPFLATLGMPARLAELSLLPTEGARVSESLVELEGWSGGRAGDALALGLAVQDRFARDPQSFLDQTTSDRLPAIAAADVNLWRVAAAQRLGSRERMLQELIGLATDRKTFYPEAFHQSYLVEQMMESRLLRRAFLDAVNTVLGAYRAGEWKGHGDALRRIIDAAASVGDPNLVNLIDALSENKEFTTKLILNGPEGLLARLEPHLTLEEWAERITLMDALNHARSIAFRAQALTLLGDGAADGLDALVAQKRFGPEALARIRRANARARELLARREFVTAREALDALPMVLRNADVQEAHRQINEAETAWNTEKERNRAAYAAAEEQYARMDFTGTAASLGSMHRDLRTTASIDLARRNASLLTIWAQYQGGDLDGALRAASAVANPDAIAIALRRRIENVALARRRLAERRPQEAQIKLDAMNGGVTDPMHATVRAEVEDTIRRAGDAFRAMRALGVSPRMSEAAIDRIRQAARATFAIDSEYETAMEVLIEKAQALFDRGDFHSSQEILHIILSETGIFNREAENFSRFEIVRGRVERLRSLGRGHEMKDWLTLQQRVIQTKLEAQLHAEARSAYVSLDPGADLKGQTFSFGSDWKIDKHGNLIVKKLWLVRPKDGRGARPGDKDVELLPMNMTDVPFQQHTNFQFTFGEGATSKRIPVSFVRRLSLAEPDLVFLPDATSGPVLARLAQEKVAGTLTYMEDISTLAQLRALEAAIAYVDKHIAAIQANKPAPANLPVIGRLLGLDLSPQPVVERADAPQLSSKFEGDSAQTGAVLAAIQPDSEVVAIQGPPGTGKTTTAVEITRHLVRAPDAQTKGRIVVMTAQAHAGVDNMAVRLQGANVPIIRSASESAQPRVTRKLQMNELERIERLMDLLEAHHKTGQGFVYLVTNNGLRGDRKCFDLLRMYLSGESMNNIRIRYAFMRRQPGEPPPDIRKIARLESDNGSRRVTRTVWGQEEAGQANVAETLVVPFSINPDKAFLFGDQDQLPPHPLDNKTEELIQQEVAAGLRPSAGDLRQVLTREAKLAMEKSLFENSYAYAARWAEHLGELNGAGIVTRFLNLARRSHWLITTAVVNVYYGGRLRHRDQHLDPSEWEAVRRDTVVMVSSDGREETDNRSSERGDDADPVGNTGSKRNYREVGEVIRAVTYHLSGRSAVDNARRKAGDILILTPYKAQNRLINEVLRWVAVANDYARGEDVSAAELEALTTTVLDHARHVRNTAGRINVSQLTSDLRSLSRTRGAARATLVAKIFAEVEPMYDLHSDSARTIRRADLPSIETQTPPPDAETVEENEELDEQVADQLEAKTVHRVQGQERRVVIVSLARSERLGFLDGRKGDQIINVATSRAEENLVIIYSRGMRPANVEKMEKNLEAVYGPGHVLQGFPTHRSVLASLRRAWGLSTGSARADDAIDRWVGPPIETVAFLAVLGLGLVAGNALMILAGLTVKLVVFPALHALPVWLGLRPPSTHINAVAALSTASVLLYAAAFFALTAGAGLPSSSAFWISLVAPTILHLVNNRDRGPLSAADLGETKSLEVDTIAGLEAQKSARLVDQLAPPVRRAPVFKYGSLRPVRSGA